MTMICRLSCLYSCFLTPWQTKIVWSRWDWGAKFIWACKQDEGKWDVLHEWDLLGCCVSCATTHEHSRMLNVTLTLFVWGFVLLQNLQDLGNKVCLRGLYVGQCWTWTVYDYHWPCQWFQIMDFGRHFVDWSQVRQLRLGHVSSIVNCMWLRCLGYVCLQVLYWLCFQPDEWKGSHQHVVPTDISIWVLNTVAYQACVIFLKPNLLIF